MTSHQGDLALLQEPVVQQLLQSKLPARLAYLWIDGTPRRVPIGFHWNGSELVFGTPHDAPKTKALHDGDAVAVSRASIASGARRRRRRSRPRSGASSTSISCAR